MFYAQKLFKRTNNLQYTLHKNKIEFIRSEEHTFDLRLTVHVKQDLRVF